MIKLPSFLNDYTFAGPVVAEAMFVNREEIPIYPIYRDPVRSIIDYACSFCCLKFYRVYRFSYYSQL